jgi:hypothetical protein
LTEEGKKNFKFLKKASTNKDKKKKQLWPCSFLAESKFYDHRAKAFKRGKEFFKKKNEALKKGDEGNYF